MTSQSYEIYSKCNLKENANELLNKDDEHNDENFHIPRVNDDNGLESSNDEDNTLKELIELSESTNDNHLVRVHVLKLLLQLYQKQKETLLLNMEKDIQEILTKAQDTIVRESEKSGLCESNEVVLNAFFISHDSNSKREPDFESEWKLIIEFLKKNPQWTSEILKLNSLSGSSEKKKSLIREFLQKVKEASLENTVYAPQTLSSTVPSISLKEESEHCNQCLVGNCHSNPMMGSKYCFSHILFDPTQKLYTIGNDKNDPKLRGEPLKRNTKFRYEFVNPDENEWISWNLYQKEKEDTLPGFCRESYNDFNSHNKSIMFNITKVDQKSNSSLQTNPELKKRALDLISSLETSPTMKRDIKSTVCKAQRSQFYFQTPLSIEEQPQTSVPDRIVRNLSDLHWNFYKVLIDKIELLLFTVNSAIELHDDSKKQILKLTRENMEFIYTKWDSDEKLKELFEEDRMRYILLYSTRGQDNTPTFVGFSSFLYDTDEERPVLYLYEIQIEHSFRGLGIGKWILEQLIHNARKLHLSHIVLTVQKKNKTAISFYERKFNFSRDETDPSLLGNNSMDYIILSREIEQD